MKFFFRLVIFLIIVILISFGIYYFGSEISYTKGRADIVDNKKSMLLATTELEEVIEEIRVATHIKTPEQIRAIYMTSWVGSSRSLRNNLIDFINDSLINAIVLDIKDYSGVISFDIDNELIDKYGTDSNRIPDIYEFIQKLHENNIYVIGRVTIFQDPLLAEKAPYLAMKKISDGQTWKDKKGLAFLDPSKQEVWEYIVAIAEESYELGFDEINFDYIRFPSDGNMEDLQYNLAEGEQRVDVLRKLYKYLNAELSLEKSIPISADLFGMTTTNTDDLGIGQNLEDALRYFDFVAPMVYPSHYPRGFNGYSNPAQFPYEIIKKSMNDGVVRAHNLGVSVKKLRPWIQDFDLGTTYDKAKIHAQLQAMYEVGLDSYMVWDPKNQYTKSAYYDDLYSVYYKEYVHPTPPPVPENTSTTTQ